MYFKKEEKIMWDKKSENYPRYNPNSEIFQNRVWEILNKEGAICKDYRLLDIGCGTGVYTIPLGKMFKEVYAMDISSKMLDILEEDAKNYSVNNIKTIHSTWDELDLKEMKFDVVFASKTPAIKESKDYKKMADYSNKYVAYLGWAGVKRSNIQNEILKIYPNIEFRKFDDTTAFKKWLEKESIEYKSTIFEDTLTREMSRDNAVTQINEYISKTDINLSNMEIENIIISIEKSGKLIYSLDVKLELILWEK
ncbi:class I SAM-dependent methyltransferase [Halarcobacter ebronensis]|uniref:Methyltransferase domain-containing protein n=1 Tax=Halarcobacter ebronensis TaxID=1462615 RepID=A0A4Q1AGT0_9BACT|nr:class I SAM-dependent methyltransferase [Halarcobacter ebronensis]QKF82981.1 SAM-dependent methyltransferase [Halarcobacter ebronensis]RXK02821.1 hypothetical protein CRV07_13115 [Halarcobacter ebronensis]